MKLRRRSFMIALVGVSLGWTATDATEKKVADSRDAQLLTASADPELVKAGRETYVALCQACHGEEKARATLGEAPSNLFDAKWYNGSQPERIEQNVLNGLLEKGMPPWKDALPPEDTTAVTAYLLSFQKRASATATPAPPPAAKSSAASARPSS